MGNTQCMGSIGNIRREKNISKDNGKHKADKERKIILLCSLVLSGQCPWCVTHLTVMPSEPLTLFIGSSATSTIQVFVHLKGWRPLYTNPFKFDDTLYLVSHASRGEVSWCGHRCALPIPRSHKWELCSCERPVSLSTSIMTRMHGWQVYKGTTSQRTTLTPQIANTRIQHPVRKLYTWKSPGDT